MQEYNLTAEQQQYVKENKARVETQEKAEQEAKKNHDFVQYSRKGLLKLSQVTNGLSHQIFHFLSREMDRENKLIISQTTLAKYFNVTRQSINLAIKELEKNNLISILKVGTANIYCLNAAVVWTQERDKIHLAKFNAKVIIDKDEQVGVKKEKLKQIKLKEEN